MDPEKIVGTVEHVVYQNEETSFSVLELDMDGELVTVVGQLAGAAIGERLTVYGGYVTHPTYGAQFKADHYERLLPEGETAILRYLSSGAIRGIGPVLGERLVSRFREHTLEIIAKEPERLTEVRGFSKGKAQEVHNLFVEMHGFREVIEAITGFGLRTEEALKLYHLYGVDAAALLLDNPYMLLGYPVFRDFSFVDALAGQLGFPKEDENRRIAGLIFVLRHNMQNGHTCLPLDRLIDTSSRFLELDAAEVLSSAESAVRDRLLIEEELHGKRYLFLPTIYQEEKRIAARLVLLNQLEFRGADDTDSLIDEAERLHGIQYAPLQKKAISLAQKSGVLVITGGPGTGKTTVIRAILGLAKRRGEKVALVAPTGRAAKRMTELTGEDATTIHRLLEVEFFEEDRPSFRHNAENPLPHNLLIIDEMSMVDTSLFSSLLSGIRPQCRLILVGDTDQLPAISAGNLLNDIIESGMFPVVELKEIFRQANESAIVRSAHHIVRGEMPEIGANNGDFFFLPSDQRDIQSLIVDLVSRRLPKSYPIDPQSDIQVLSPHRKGLSGIEALNDALQASLNPPSDQKRERHSMGRIFREGDRIMQIKNNYDMELRHPDFEQKKGVFNGDIGWIEEILDDGEMVVLFDDGKRATYPPESQGELELAYAATVHKSQGSEFRFVVLALSGIPEKLCYRHLLYTAVTRAKELLVIVGSERQLRTMVENNKKRRRFTALIEWIHQEQFSL